MSEAEPRPYAVPSGDLAYQAIEKQVSPLHDLPGSELKKQGRDVRGIYIPASFVTNKKAEKFVAWVVERVGATAVILDIKDDMGRVTFSKDLPGAEDPAHGFVRNMPEIIRLLKDQGVYTIGRLVCFKDNKFTRAHPKEAIRDRRTKKRWRARRGESWIDPYSQLGRNYITSVAVAAKAVGFDEIQFDYVRFPVEPASRYAWYTHRPAKTERYKAIVGLLAQVDRALDIPISIDVFGLTAYHTGDKNGLGQSLEHLAPYIDAISPMLYLANWSQHVWQNPNPSRTRAMVHNAVLRIRRRLGDHIAVRPLLQAFKYRAENFGADFIVNQINAAESAGSSGYLFWNQSGKYKILTKAWGRQIRPHILTPKPFRQRL
jgi:hypothetical protein